MRILPLLTISVLLFFSGRLKDSPHGPDFKISCGVCHSSSSWQFDKAIYSFDHNTTKMPLTGQHKETDCRICHPTLVFSEAKSECVDCHQDVHQASLSLDCSRCHTSSSWLVSNITEIHQMGRFPLLGAHRTAACLDCHKSENSVRFDVRGVNCIDCHRSIYLATLSPDHVQSGFSEDCSVCHPVNASQWAGAGFNHNFFPLVQAHSRPCADCHTSGSYPGLSSECTSCHQAEFQSAKNPDHILSDFPTNCKLCHSFNPGWKPASFRQHDSQSFPIYSGKHEGEWNTCSDCHSNSSNYKIFSCINCHEHNKNSMDNKHRGEARGYSYNSSECYRCHHNGKAD